jgi:DNA polymerase III epsilon subunit-like protein
MLDPTIYSSFSHLNGSLLCAVDVETTGCMPGYHEIIQIAIVPLDSNIEPIDSLRPFYMTISPQYPDRLDKEAFSKHKLDISVLAQQSLDSTRVADLFDEWFQRLNLPYKKSLVPLAHNWVFEAGFLKAWLGLTGFNSYWHPHPRDTMQMAIAANDRAYMRGDKLPYERVALKSLCHYFNIKLEHAHDALHDALATAKVFQNLLRVPLF